MDTKICPRCAEEIKSAAVVCRYCGHEFAELPVAQADPVQKVSATMSGEKDKTIGCLMLLALIAAIFMIGRCANSTDSEPTASPIAALPENETAAVSGAPSVVEQAVMVESAPISKWSYNSWKDEARGKMVHTAEITSENSIYLDFPYNGTNHLRITIRKHPSHGEDVIFTIDKGQILCHSYSENCKGLINVDGKPETLSFVEAADNDSSVVFAAYGSAIASKLKKSKRVIIELPFFQNGNQQFTFETAHLEWPPK